MIFLFLVSGRVSAELCLHFDLDATNVGKFSNGIQDRVYGANASILPAYSGVPAKYGGIHNTSLFYDQDAHNMTYPYYAQFCNFTNNNFSVSMWFTRVSVLNDGFMASTNWGDSNFNSWSIRNDNMNIWVMFRDGGGTQHINKSGFIDGYGWHNVVLTYNHTSQEMRNYIDGKPFGIMDNAVPISWEHKDWNQLLIGKWRDNLVHFATKALLDDLMMWNHTLTPQEVNNTYYDGIGIGVKVRDLLDLEPVNNFTVSFSNGTHSWVRNTSCDICDFDRGIVYLNESGQYDDGTFDPDPINSSWSINISNVSIDANRVDFPDSDTFSFEWNPIIKGYTLDTWSSRQFWYAQDGIRRKYLTDWTAELPNGSVVVSNNLTTYFHNNTHRVNASKVGFLNDSDIVEFEPMMTLNHTFYLYQTYNFSLYYESNRSEFDVGQTDKTELTVYCTNQTTQNYTFSISSYVTNITCEVSYVKIAVDWVIGGEEQTYFRTLVLRDTTTSNISLYLIDLVNETAVQRILKLNDLIGDYINGYILVRRTYGNDIVNIISQFYDFENKVNLYLLKGIDYNLVLISNTGVEKNLGYLSADYASESELNVVSPDYIPTSVLGEDISWAWSWDESSYIKLAYRDTTGNTTDIRFYVWNGSNTSQQLYYSTSTNSEVDFTYNANLLNHSYIAGFVVVNSSASPARFADNKTFSIYDYVDLSAWGEHEQTIKTWFAIIILALTLLIFSRFYMAAGLTAAAFEAALFVNIGMIDTGISYMNAALPMILGVLAFFAFYVDSRTKWGD